MLSHRATVRVTALAVLELVLLPGVKGIGHHCLARGQLFGASFLLIPLVLIIFTHCDILHAID